MYLLPLPVSSDGIATAGSVWPAAFLRGEKEGPKRQRGRDPSQLGNNGQPLADGLSHN